MHHVHLLSTVSWLHFLFYFLNIFLAFDFCRFCMVIRFFISTTTANDLRLRRIFYHRFYPLHLFSYLNSWERASTFPFECSVLNKGTTGTIFLTSLVWCGHWLGIEPGTSRTRSQHSTTRLSRRRYGCIRLKRICNWNTWRFFKRKQYLADILTIVWPVIFMHLYAPSRLLGNLSVSVMGKHAWRSSYHYLLLQWKHLWGKYYLHAVYCV